MSELRCHFCKRSHLSVELIVMSDTGATICNHCIDIAAAEMAEQRRKMSAPEQAERGTR